MSSYNKPILNVDEQINHLLGKGVKFEICTIDEAKQYLLKNNNYFKLSSYRKNYPKQIDGKKVGNYINLDFEMLKDLAIIDMRLRYVLLHMALDIEHYLKVDLIQTAQENGEDGYKIVSDYFDKLKSIDDDDTNLLTPYTSLKTEIRRNEDNPFCGELIKKHKNKFPIWAFVEIIAFGRLLNFYNFCQKCFKNNSDDKYHMLLAVKELRNACAHSNCLINDLNNNNQRHSLNYTIGNELKKIGISKETKEKK